MTHRNNANPRKHSCTPWCLSAEKGHQRPSVVYSKYPMSSNHLDFTDTSRLKLKAVYRSQLMVTLSDAWYSRSQSWWSVISFSRSPKHCIYFNSVNFQNLSVVSVFRRVLHTSVFPGIHLEGRKGLWVLDLDRHWPTSNDTSSKCFLNPQQLFHQACCLVS